MFPAPTAAQLERVVTYLTDTLGVALVVEPGDSATKLPALLAQFYTPVAVQLLNRPCLLLLLRQTTVLTAATARKHIDLTSRYTEALPIVVAPAVDAPTRAKLIAQRVPFIVPGNQLYLPDLGLDLREHFRQLRNPTTQLTPAALLTVLDHVVHPHANRFTPQHLAERLGYSAMTMTRVADELEHLGLLTSERAGRSRQLIIAAVGRQLWARALPHLRSPVVGRQLLRLPLDFLCAEAGLTALARQTALAAPVVPEMATGPTGQQTLKTLGIQPLTEPEPGAVLVEVWSFDPQRLVVDRRLHPAVLWLTLRDHSDDRVQLALNELMEAAW